MSNWFEIDRKGLAKIMARKGPEFIVFELLQNAWDEDGVSFVNVTLVQSTQPGYCELVVEDDSPAGFTDITHAYTLFAESKKKGQPTKRGRFNLGEKLVLALAKEAKVETTTGTVRFDEEGRHRSGKRREVGSQVSLLIKMKEADRLQIIDKCNRLIPPDNITTRLNTKLLTRPACCLGNLSAPLYTEVADAEGNLLRACRNTEVNIYAADETRPAGIYEMGIPVCEIEGRYVIDVGQKVPLTIDRDEVLPGFKKQLGVAVLNHMAKVMDKEDMNLGWVAQAAASPDAKPQAVTSYLDQKFGTKRVAFDPSDPEANKIATSQGYTVVHGGMMSAGAWSNAKNAGAIQPAGQVTPSGKVWTGEGNPDASQFNDWIPQDKWTPGMKRVAAFAQKLATKLMHVNIDVRFCCTPQMIAAAAYGPGGPLDFNKLRLGNDFFEEGLSERVVALVIHEFGHQYASDHLSEEYYDALCKLGARLFLTKAEL